MFLSELVYGNTFSVWEILWAAKHCELLYFIFQKANNANF